MEALRATLVSRLKHSTKEEPASTVTDTSMIRPGMRPPPQTKPPRHAQPSPTTARQQRWTASQVFRAIELIAGSFQTLPDYVRARVTQMAPTLSAARDVYADNDGFKGAVTALQIVCSAPTEPEVLSRLLHFRRDDPATFVKLLKFWTSSQKLFLLASLAADSDPQVRGYAIYGLIDLADKHADKEDEIADLIGAALDLSDGSLMHRSAAFALNGLSNQGFQKLRDVLLAHPSALIRNQMK
ncbi:hypothetical protein QMY03_09715 [Arthrobacter sp. KFRI-F3372]|nr:hypothetical protein QMY03_09715 [Arthrobacter sp. KFRI-F3372]